MLRLITYYTFNTYSKISSIDVVLLSEKEVMDRKLLALEKTAISLV